MPFHPSFHLGGETQRNIGLWGAALRRSQGFPAEPEVLGLSSRVRRAAPSLQIQPEETVVASCGPTKTAILTMLSRSTAERRTLVRVRVRVRVRG